MKSEPQWLSTNVAPEIIYLSPVTVKNKFGSELKWHLEVEKNNGLLKVSAKYNSSPFPNTVNPATFNLTQEQLDEYLDKGAKCVLNVPTKG